MSPMSTTLRRAIWLVTIAAIIGAALARWRARADADVAPATPEWPPLSPDLHVVPPVTDTASGAAAAAGSDAATSVSPETASSFAEPHADGSCPNGYPIKAKESSGIYHVPGGRFHERTNPDRCYATAADAEADGYRRSKS